LPLAEATKKEAWQAKAVALRLKEVFPEPVVAAADYVALISGSAA
jgi:hypothetical protein